MATEIRDYGDQKTIVVYTDDNNTAANLKDRKTLIKEIEYHQDTKNGVRCVGKDFYFPKRQLRSICRGLGLKTSRGFTLGKFHQIQI